MVQEKKLNPQAEIEILSAKSVAKFAQSMFKFAVANLRGNVNDITLIGQSIEEQAANQMTLADLLGRRRMLLEADAMRGRQQPAEGLLLLQAAVPKDLPNVPFEEALQDIASREPRLADSADAINRLYQTRHSFAVRRSADISLTRKIQRIIETSAREGRPADSIENIERLGDFSRAYAQTVYRTNLNTAYTAGRFQQARDPDVAQVIGAMEYVTAGDADVRPNHALLDGIIAGVSDPFWNVFSPPNGYECRCSVRMVSRSELSRRNLIADGRVLSPRIPAGAAPDKGFGTGRPDNLIYG